MPSMIPLGTKTRWGKVVAIAALNGERYYFLTSGESVAMLPADLVESAAGRSKAKK
jgi:hypothetical protein